MNEKKYIFKNIHHVNAYSGGRTNITNTSLTTVKCGTCSTNGIQNERYLPLTLHMTNFKERFFSFK